MARSRLKVRSCFAPPIRVLTRSSGPAWVVLFRSCHGRAGKGRTMRLGRASLTTAFLAVISLCVAGTASSAGTRPVTATTITVQSATCSVTAQKGNVVASHCTGGIETWVGDITGTGTASRRSPMPVFLVPAVGACTRDGTRMTCRRVLSRSSRASRAEPARLRRLMDRFESSTTSTSSTRARSASRH